MKNILLIVLLIIVLSFTSIVYGSDAFVPSTITPSDITSLEGSELVDFGNKITGAVRTAGVIVAIAMILFLGIQFMLAAPSEKANIKEKTIPYIVGALLVFATTALVDIIYNLRI